MNERDRLERQQWERAEKEKSDEQISKLTAEAARLHGQLYKQRQAALAHGVNLETFELDIYKGCRPEPFLSPSLVGVGMSKDEAADFNGQAAHDFVIANPWFYRCEHNFKAVLQAMQQNGIAIFDVPTLERVARALDSAGLLEHEPLPEPVKPVATPELDKDLPRLPLNHRYPIAHKREPDTPQVGFDQTLGKEREFTSWEISQMSAEEYKRTFRVKNVVLAKGLRPGEVGLGE